jgi:hypothetical protein
MKSFARYLGTDKALERGGVWTPLPEYQNDDGTIPSFLLGRMSESNIRWQGQLTMLRKKYGVKLTNGTMPDNQVRAVNRRAFVEGCIFDTQNITDDDGPVGNNADRIEAVLIEFPEIWDTLAEKANSADHYLAPENAADRAGNS